jgi:phosphoglucosamine mutase
VVRASGTEPVIRVMGEADDATLVSTVVGQVEAAIRDVA